MIKHIFMLCILLISGCGIARQQKAAEDMSQSKIAYKDCLNKNQNTPNKCDAQKSAYEADVRDWDAVNLNKNGSINNSTTINNH